MFQLTERRVRTGALHSPLTLVTILAGALLASPALLPAQGFGNFNKSHAKTVLKTLKSELEKNYYDVSIKSPQLDEHFKQAEAKLDQATSTSQLFAIIAQAMVALNDSHTTFFPPERTTDIEYGWQMQMIGDKCFVVAVKPGSDAEKKGLKAGDQILEMDGFTPNRQTMWQIHYAYYSIRPQPAVRFKLQAPDGSRRELQVETKMVSGKRLFDLHSEDIWKLIRDAESESRLHRHRYHEMDPDLFIWKMPQFDMEDDEVDRMMGRARKSKAMILDMRGNGGGLVDTLERLSGYFVESDTKIADLKGRKKMDPQQAKTRGNDVFKGKLVMLIDSQSGSAAEVFSRFMQLQKRGTVIGDHSAGAVMQSKFYPLQLGADTVIFYSASITNADVIMGDGESLEKVGVEPDEVMLPTGQDIASNHDPVLAHASELVGVKLSPAEAGAMFPVEWRK